MQKSQIIRAIKHPLRSKILKMLGSRTAGPETWVENPKEMCVTDLYITCRVEQSVMSQHLTILRDAGLVVFSEDSKRHIYRLSDEYTSLVNNLGDVDVAHKLHRATNKGKNRQMVIKWLSENPQSQVAHIAPGLERSVVSQELKILRDAGVVGFVKEGKKRIYRMK